MLCVIDDNNHYHRRITNARTFVQLYSTVEFPPKRIMFTAIAVGNNNNSNNKHKQFEQLARQFQKFIRTINSRIRWNLRANFSRLIRYLASLRVRTGIDVWCEGVGGSFNIITFQRTNEQINERIVVQMSKYRFIGTAVAKLISQMFCVYFCSVSLILNTHCCACRSCHSLRLSSVDQSEPIHFERSQFGSDLY